MILVYSDLGDITVLRLGRSFISHWKDYIKNISYVFGVGGNAELTYYSKGGIEFLL